MAGKIQTETQPDSDILQTSFPHRLGGAYWRSFVNSGEIAIGKNVVSADAAKPDPGASGCTEYGGPENSTAWATRVTSFAHQAQICDVSHGPWTAGFIFEVAVCGVTVDGKPSAFFPAPPLPP